ncbi:morphogenic membrane protein MmpA [Streptomyces sp. NPDC127066]
MTTHQAPKPSAESAPPVGLAVTAALALAVPASLAWTAGMIYTVIVWAS